MPETDTPTELNSRIRQFRTKKTNGGELQAVDGKNIVIKYLSHLK